MYFLLPAKCHMPCSISQPEKCLLNKFHGAPFYSVFSLLLLPLRSKYLPQHLIPKRLYVFYSSCESKFNTHMN